MSRDIKHMANDMMRIQREVREFVSSDYPTIIAVEAENHFKRSFDNQGFTDTVLQKWKVRDVDTNPQNYSKKQIAQSKSRAILIGNNSGDKLRDSIHTIISPSHITITSNKAYAQIHNEGGKAGRNLSANIPKRQFIGHSTVLNLNIKRKVDRTMNQIFRNR